eukprot:TRINITY_DN16108_c0_g1_i1.p1 TRINITY_DN16108_c0_g1~~TRINITY_DN16108_c0_g1_i1.p1  ORF type:complete len:647 (+),score=197.62 TRINITY_DN16108_c0_g1_i1:55-1995(+)
MDEYEPLETIGYGSFGRVAKIRRRADNRIFVWKEMDFGKMTDKEKQFIVTEVNILRSFRHPYIVRYYDRIIDREQYKIYIVMEYCENGDLAAVIKRNKQHNTFPDERQVWRIALQLCLALEACHTRKDGKVLHRDIKPANVLLDADNIVKLGDFGLARTMSDQSTFAHSNVGTPYYMSPEQIREQGYDEKTDVWGLGCVLYEYSQNRPPFQATNQLSLAMKIKQGTYREIKGVSPELTRLIGMCLTADPARRPSVEDLLAMPCLSIRLKEKKLSNHYLELRKREEDVDTRSREVEERERALLAREADVARREQAVKAREDAVAARERERERSTSPPHNPSPLRRPSSSPALNLNARRGSTSPPAAPAPSRRTTSPGAVLPSPHVQPRVRVDLGTLANDAAQANVLRYVSNDRPAGGYRPLGHPGGSPVDGHPVGDAGWELRTAAPPMRDASEDEPRFISAVEDADDDDLHVAYDMLGTDAPHDAHGHWELRDSPPHSGAGDPNVTPDNQPPPAASPAPTRYASTPPHDTPRTHLSTPASYAKQHLRKQQQHTSYATPHSNSTPDRDYAIGGTPPSRTSSSRDSRPSSTGREGEARQDDYAGPTPKVLYPTHYGSPQARANTRAFSQQPRQHPHAQYRAQQKPSFMP